MRTRILTFFGNALLILTAVHCTTGAVISAFSLTIDTGTLYPVWIVVAIALPALAALWRGKGLLLLLPPALLILILRLQEIVDGAKWTILRITSEYNKWLHVPVFFPDASATTYEATLFFAIAGIALAFLLSVAICLRHSAALTVFFTAPAVFLAFILTETRPDNRFLLGLLAVYLTLIICCALRPDDFIKRGTAIFPALALAVLLLGTTYVVAHPDNFRRGGLVMDIDSQIRETVERAGLALNKTGAGWPVVYDGAWRFNTDRVPVSDAGSRTILDQSILRIKADHAGVFYLRGYSMQRFNGREWRDNADERALPGEPLSMLMPFLIAWLYDVQHYPVSASVMASMTVTRTGDTSDIIYQPYYSTLPLDGNPYTVEFLYVEDSIPELYSALDAGLYNVAVSSTFDELSKYNEQVRAQSVYTEIEDSTAAELRRIAFEAGISPDDDRTVIADSVAELISKSARYTLTPYVIPDGEDFVLHFLQTSRRGYCIHFATAATLMLRALDVPARFTSGFVVTVSGSQVGKDVVVTDRNAHAWVEVYYDDIGWIPLEVTPPAPGSGVPGDASQTVVGSGGAYGNGYDEIYEDEYYDIGMYFPAITASPTSLPDAGPEEPDQHGPAGFGAYVLIVASCIAACVLLLVSHRYLARKYREKRFAHADTNGAVIYIWRYVVRLDRHAEQPEEIEELALKARFSQHRISEEERAAMIGYARKLSAKTYVRQSIFGRIWIKYVLGL